MAEMSVTPKKSKNSMTNTYDKSKMESRERKRNILYLIQSYLKEQKLYVTAEALENETQLSTQYQACENIDLDIILQEYQSYYYTKFQKYPKIIRKLDGNVDLSKPDKRKNSAKIRQSESKEKNSIQSESEDFQFEIISLSNDKTNEFLEKTPEKHLCTFENYTQEWKEMADQIVKEFVPKNLNIEWKDCIGLSNAAEKLKEATIYPSLYPDIFKDVPTWKALLLFGPPGTGKTLLAKALATENSTFINVSSSTFISKWRGESEKMLKVLFDVAKIYAPTIIFIDEVDALASTDSVTYHEASKRFKSELLTQIDGIQSSEFPIFILGSTNTPWNLDKAMLRRFEKRILVQLPHEESRIDILKHYLPKPNNIEHKELVALAKTMVMFSGSDIKTLCKEVQMSRVREKIKEIDVNGSNKTSMVLRRITYKDVELSLRKIKPCITEPDRNKFEEWNEKYGSW